MLRDGVLWQYKVGMCTNKRTFEGTSVRWPCALVTAGSLRGCCTRLALQHTLVGTLVCWVRARHLVRPKCP